MKIFLKYRNTRPQPYNLWSDHKTADLVLTELQNTLHLKAKVPYASNAKQANMANVLPKII